MAKFSRDQIIAKVSKLMATASVKIDSSSTASERATAEAQMENAANLAARLMTEHQISEHEVKAAKGEEKKAPKEIEVWFFEVNNKNFAGLMRRDALAQIGEALGARALSSIRKTPGGNTKGFLVHFYATADVLDTLKIVIPALSLTAESRVQGEASEKRNGMKVLGYYTSRDITRESDQFIKGWWTAYGYAASRKVRAVRKHTAQEYDGTGKGELVLQSESDRINAHINGKFSKLGKASRNRTRYSRESIEKGQQAGREAMVGQDEVTEETRAALN